MTEVQAIVVIECLHELLGQAQETNRLLRELVELAKAKK